MNEKSKKINIIDIGVILIIILFIAGIGIRFFHSTSKTLKETVCIEYTVAVENIRQYTLDALSKSSLLTDKDNTSVIGEITALSEASAYVPEAIAKNGEFVESPMPGKFKTILTVRSDVRKTDNRYFLTEDVEASLGKDFTVITKYAQTTGTITSIKEIPAESAK